MIKVNFKRIYTGWGWFKQPKIIAWVEGYPEVEYYADLQALIFALSAANLISRNIIDKDSYEICIGDHINSGEN